MPLNIIQPVQPINWQGINDLTNNLRENKLLRRSEELTQQALSGNPNALSGLYSVNPHAARFIHEQQQTSKKERQAEGMNYARGAVISLLQAPAEQRPQLWKQAVGRGKQEYGEMFGAVPDEYSDQAFNEILSRASEDKIISKVLEQRLGLQSENVPADLQVMGAAQNWTPAQWETYKKLHPDKAEGAKLPSSAQEYEYLRNLPPDQQPAYQALIGKEGAKPDTKELPVAGGMFQLHAVNPVTREVVPIGQPYRKAEGAPSKVQEFEYAQNLPADKRKQFETFGQKPSDLPDPSGLRKEYSAQSQPFIKVRDSYARVTEAAKNPSPAGDLSLLYNYMKILDPDSVVRESEFATAAASGSWGERLQGAAQRLLNGERLTDAQRADFANTAKTLYDRQLLSHQALVKQFTGIAERGGLNPDDVAYDLNLVEPAGIEQLTHPGRQSQAPQGASANRQDILDVATELGISPEEASKMLLQQGVIIR